MKKNYWRLDREQYKTMSKDIASKRESVDDWKNISLSGELSREELMCRIMMDNDPKYHSGTYICQLYVCEAYDIDEDFLKDIIYVNSGLAIMGLWDKKVIDWVLKIHSKEVKNSTNIGNALKYVKEALKEGTFNDIPEYESFLRSFMEEYYKISKELREFAIPDTDDEQEIANAILKASDAAVKIKNYAIEVHDRLDWDAIENRNSLTYGFLLKYSKKNRYNEKVDSDQSLSMLNNISRKTYKYTANKSPKKIKKVRV